MLSVRTWSVVHVAVNQRTTVIWTKQPFMWINNEAVGTFNTDVLVAHTWRTQTSGSVGTIDVKPHIEFLSHVGDY